MSSDADRAGRAGSIWARPAPGSRRPRFTRKQIAEAAIAIADAEGLEALSMRRLADELGAGTMTLYHYVASKRDVLELMEDAMYAELLAPDDELATGWRDGLERMARRIREGWERRPWAFGLHHASLGPTGMRFFDQSLAAMSDAPLDAMEKMEAISFVQYYVLGFVMHEYAMETSEHVAVEDIASFMTAQLQTGGFPHIDEVIGDGGAERFLRRLDTVAASQERFERGLACLLDGIDARIGGR